MTTDKAKGKGNQVIGEAKKRVGDVTGDQKLKDEGTEQNAKGKGQEIGGKVKETVEKVKEKLT